MDSFCRRSASSIHYKAAIPIFSINSVLSNGSQQAIDLVSYFVFKIIITHKNKQNKTLITKTIITITVTRHQKDKCAANPFKLSREPISDDYYCLKYYIYVINYINHVQVY